MMCAEGDSWVHLTTSRGRAVFTRPLTLQARLRIELKAPHPRRGIPPAGIACNMGGTRESRNKSSVFAVQHIRV